METLEFNETNYYDPFADGEEYDPNQLFDEIFDKYQNNRIEHDYTADNFVRDTEALMLDAQFTNQFTAFESIAARMHQLCGDDHAIAAAVNNGLLLGNKQDEHGHDHSHTHSEDDADEKNHKKVKPGRHAHGASTRKHEPSQKNTRPRLSFDDLIKMLVRSRVSAKNTK